MKRISILNILLLLIILPFAVFAQSNRKKVAAFVYYSEYDSALYYLQEAIKMDPENAALYLLKGDILYKKGNLNGAINNYLTADKLKPHIADFQLARVYAKTGDVKKSCELLETLLKNRKVSMLEVKRNKDFAAVTDDKCFEEITANVRVSAYDELLNDLWFDLKYGNTNDALDKIDDFLAKNNKKHYLFYLKGKILLSVKDTAGALKNFYEAFRLKKSNEKYILAYSNILMAKKKYKKALSVLKLRLKKYSGNPFYMKAYGAALYYNGEYSAAINVLKDSVLQYLYKDTAAYYLLAESYYKQRHYFPALKAINKAIELYPGNDEYIFLRGKIYYETRAYKIAIKDFKHIIDLQPFNGKYYFYLGLVQLKTGEEYNACKNFKKAFSLKYMKADSYLRKECVK